MNKDYRSPDVVKPHDDLISRYYKISARNEGQLNMLEKIFVYIQYLSIVGASRSINIYVDGDGAVSFKFKSHDENGVIFDDLDYDVVMDKDSGYGSVNIDEDNSYFDLG